MGALVAMAAVVALSGLLAILWYKKSPKFQVLGMVVNANGSLSILVPDTSQNPSDLYSKHIEVFTESLGRLRGTVCSVTKLPGGQMTINTSAGVYTGSGTYVLNSNDHILISVV